METHINPADFLLTIALVSATFAGFASLASVVGQALARMDPRVNAIRLRQRGLSSIAAFVAHGRKLARLCFALARNGTDFRPEIYPGGCHAT